MSIRIKRISTLFLSLMLTMSSFAGFFTENEVFGGTGVDRVKTKITKFEIKDSNGNSIPQGQPLGYWNKFRLEMDWDASMYGAELKENDYFTITLPKQFIFPKDGQYVNFPLYVPGTNTVIANAHVDSNGVAGGGTVKVTFTKYVEGKDNIRGNLFLEATFAHHNINAGQQNTIIVSIGGVPTQVDINIGPKPTLNDEVFTKWGEKVNGNENEAQWVLRINHKKGNFSDVVIRDELFVSSGNLPPGIHYLPESFELNEVEMDEYGVVKKVIKTYTYNDLKQHLKFSGNNTKFEFEFSKLLGNTQGKQFRMGYKSTYIPQLMLKNKSSFQSEEKDYKSDSYWVNSQAGGGGQGDLIQKIKIIKIDEENNETRLPNAEFKITNVADGSQFTLTTNAQGEAVSDKLKPGKYKIKETKAPVGYVLDPTEHEVTVVAGEALFWTGKNKRSKVNIPVTKKWIDADNQDGKRPDSIKIQLLADGKEVPGKTLTLTKDNNWTDSFKNLDEYKGENKIKYTIKEVKVENGYTSVTTGSAKDGFTVTNTRTPEKTKVEGEKTWNDAGDQDGKRPKEITVNLLANGQPIQNKDVKPDGDGNWKYSFTDLDKYKDGKPIKYTVTEDVVAEYTPEITGYNIKNSYTPKKTTVTVTKNWDDANNQDGVRPDSIKVQLYGDDKKVGDEVELKKNTGWTYTWKDLPEKKAGKVIKYTVKEVGTVGGYTTTHNNDNPGNIIITNKHVPEKTKIEGKKTWEDNNDQDKKRPTKIKVNLLADKQIVQSKEITPDTDGNWKYEFTDLDKNKDGKPIQYTVTEEPVAGYKSKIDGYNITNSYKPEETSVKVTKKWEDANNQDGKRPENIKVQLYGNDKKVEGEVTLNEGNGWTHTWTKLPKNEAGNPINYTVKEVGTVEHYTTSYGKDSQGNPIICNKHTPEKTKVEGEKTWDDANDQDGKRPTEITVNLLANGKKVKEAKVTKDTNWKYSFTDLPKYEGGKEIEYTVNENPVAEYNFSSNGGYNIKNSYTPGKTSVTVTKRWDDANNQDGKRPNSIKVQLYGNDEKVGGEVELTDGNWTHTWNDLPEKKAGKTIKYTVKEVGTVAGYTTSYSDENHGNIVICNKYTPEKTKVEGEKTWDDADDQDGKRPTSITVNLIANGKKVAEKTVTKDDNWKYSFTDLPKYEGGKEIKYTVTENAVPEYNNEVTGYNIKNSYTPKKTSVTVTKSWDDANNQDGKRPDTIKVQLYGDNEKVGGEVELKKATGWTHTWNDLPEKKAGKTIKYTVKEVGTVEGYETSYNNDNHGNIIICNKHVPEKTKVEGKKTWDDAEDQDGKRPEEITVNLLKNGAKFKSVTVKPDADGNWKYEFTDLDKYENGEEIKYTVTEDTVKDYNFSSEGYNIKNSYTPKETSVTVTKRWNDSNDKDKLRPESIKVQLYANGEKKGEAVELKADSNWSHTWNNLPEKAKGKDIKYTVKEVDKLKGYTVSVDDKDHGNIIITNTHTPKEITHPKTGDINKLIPYAMMLFASLIVLMVMIVSRRRVAN